MYFKQKIKNVFLVFITTFVLLLTVSITPHAAYSYSSGDEEIDLPEIPAPGDLRCRCHSDGQCYGGNFISFRKKCANFEGGTGSCGDHGANCPQ